MSKKVIIYATKSGKTKAIAEKIQSKIGDVDVFDAADFNASDVSKYDFLILGTSTTGHGDIQQTWKDLLPAFLEQSFVGKTVALFGLGNRKFHGDTFCAGMSHLYAALNGKVNLLKGVSTEGYTFDSSSSVIGDKFVGLALDQDNEPELADARIGTWLTQILK